MFLLLLLLLFFANMTPNCHMDETEAVAACKAEQQAAAEKSLEKLNSS